MIMITQMGWLHLIHLLYPLILAALLTNCYSESDERKVFIVYLGDKPIGDVSVSSKHQFMLESVLGSGEIAKESLIHSYGKSFNGFVAKLTDAEVARFEDMEGVVSVIPDAELKLHTTKSWDFMGFTLSSIGYGDAHEGDVIIGILDSGIWPESESFNDKDLGPPPSKWKGTCQSEKNFTCNNKVIGARYYNLYGYYPPGDFKSPRDSQGHGTHTASTAAGRKVEGASYFGLAEGLARGGAPNVHNGISSYNLLMENKNQLPDLTAPGVDILAAWSPLESPTELYEDHSSVMYNIASGTSMSCPHATGAAAYLKTIHPSWSPAAIKSALMTTASVMDPLRNNDKEFAYGSGHLNPLKAADPGLIFDASEADYVDFLCKQGYKTTTLRLITGEDGVCNNTEPMRGWDLNYPSFCLAIVDGNNITGTFTRTLTNIGSPNSTYYANMDIPTPLLVTVEPQVVSFSSTGEKQSFTVKVSGPEMRQQPIISGSITWKDETHEVRTPLVVYTVLPSTLSLHPDAPTTHSINWPKYNSFFRYNKAQALDERLGTVLHSKDRGF